MNVKNYIIILITLILLAGIIITGFFFKIVYLWVCSFLLIFVVLLYIKNRKIGVIRLLRTCNKYSGEKKINKSRFLISSHFKNSNKYNIFSDFSPEKVDKISLIRKNSIITTYSATLSDGKQYIFEIMKRIKCNDGNDIFSWVVNDIKGHEFGK